MIDNKSQNNSSNDPVPTEPLVEFFRLEGVNGYKTIELRCEKSAKIVSAENGSGKTTLLNALYGVLAGKPRQLQKINFERFVIKFANQKELSVQKLELSPLPSNIIDLIREHSSPLLDFSMDEDSLVDALTKLSMGQQDEFRESFWHEEFYRRSPFDYDDILQMCTDALDAGENRENRISEIEEYVSKGLEGATVLYLPTYRRIEAEMPGAIAKSGIRRNTRIPQNRNPYASRRTRSSWKTDQLIYFGLEDVENKLKDIAQTIKSGTFEAYTRIGGRTLEQLLLVPGRVERSGEEIDLANLRVVLARLGKNNSEVETRISELINNGDINKSQHAYLRSFLAQLLEVYASNKDQEQAIEAFVDVINSYWSNDFDEKEFVFDKLSVSTRVENKFTSNSLPLNALSSGEKQIVSVFARLYLSGDSRFVVLIDEPELSLSMDWQKRFLPDILRAPSCAQMVAITHSPFVFDNCLDPFAGPLNIKNEKPTETIAD